MAVAKQVVTKPNLGAHSPTPIDKGLREKLVVMVRSAAKEESLDPALVCAIVDEESNWEANTFAMDAEFLARHVRLLRQVMLPTEAIGRSTRFGLMQIYGQVARELGFLNTFDSLCNPTVGLIWGCRHLAGLMRQVREEAKQQNSESNTADPVSELDIVRGTLVRWNHSSDKKYADRVIAKVSKYQ